MIAEIFIAVAWCVAFWVGVFALAMMPRRWRLWLLGVVTLPVLALVVTIGFKWMAGLAMAIVVVGYCLYPTREEQERNT
jgi:hypothetical protein